MKLMMVLAALMFIVGANDQKIKIDVYIESLCPYCKALVTGSFLTAYKKKGFTDMVDITFWPYGNAYFDQNGKVSCQHG